MAQALSQRSECASCVTQVSLTVCGRSLQAGKVRIMGQSSRWAGQAYLHVGQSSVGVGDGNGR